MMRDDPFAALSPGVLGYHGHDVIDRIRERKKGSVGRGLGPWTQERSQDNEQISHPQRPLGDPRPWPLMSLTSGPRISLAVRDIIVFIPAGPKLMTSGKDKNAKTAKTARMKRAPPSHHRGLRCKAGARAPGGIRLSAWRTGSYAEPWPGHTSCARPRASRG
jgi:hypothetical protein